MKIYICDRCGKKLDTANDKVAAAATGSSCKYFGPPYDTPCYDKEYDLCNDCMEGLKEYMKGETNGETETDL